MEVMHGCCAGLDISKRDVKVCVRSQRPRRKQPDREVTTWSSMTEDVLELRDYLLGAQVSCVVMEATSDYWKTFYYLLEDAPFEVMLVLMPPDHRWSRIAAYCGCSPFSPTPRFIERTGMLRQTRSTSSNRRRSIMSSSTTSRC